VVGTTEIDDAYGAVWTIHYLPAKGCTTTRVSRCSKLLSRWQAVGGNADSCLFEIRPPMNASEPIIERRPDLCALAYYNDLVANMALQACTERGQCTAGSRRDLL
jgi:hypothetical protein